MLCSVCLPLLDFLRREECKSVLVLGIQSRLMNNCLLSVIGHHQSYPTKVLTAGTGRHLEILHIFQFIFKVPFLLFPLQLFNASQATPEVLFWTFKDYGVGPMAVRQMWSKCVCHPVLSNYTFLLSMLTNVPKCQVLSYMNCGI